MRQVWAGAILLLAAGCAAEGRLPPGAEVVRATPRPEAGGAATAQGETRLDVRSFSTDGQEVTGARCIADSSLFTAEVTAPARILAPYYGPYSPNVTVSCSAGSATGSQTVGIGQSRGGLGGWPAVGVSVNSGGYSDGVGVGVGWYGGGYGYGAPQYRYPTARVVLQ
jgi:hypothetical protein